MARRDGRSANQLRPPQVELRPLQRADGSARFRFGDCTVLAAVYGPKEPRTRHRELCDRCTLDVVVRPRVGIPGPQERQMEALLARQLEYVVLATEYPRTQISVIVQMSCCDGSTAAVAGNAAHLALLDAGVAMKATAMCVALGVTWEALVMGEDGDLGKMVKLSPEPVIWPLGVDLEASSGNKGQLDTYRLDPTELEEAQCDALISLSMDGSRNQLVSHISSGAPLDATIWSSCIEAADKSCKACLDTAFSRVSRDAGTARRRHCGTVDRRGAGAVRKGSKRGWQFATG
ncbi:Exosome complex exonuclease RRP46 homolog (Exosome component 5) (Ribosomal RNA-processing protein 46) (oRrp46) [Durusdinium trenchii]|uniref:Exosome complex exonuclease RRP46 homolog (Exosome component 5) (Ribosomal RNA-processing protein 46) (ORrp46) n=1 Tax=Durusdinium trenchii TaxID=1381693 RepID=A0ABP0P0B6_9DINO